MRLTAWYNKSYPIFVPNIRILAAAVPEKSLTNQIGEKGKKMAKQSEYETEESRVLLTQNTLSYFTFILNFSILPIAAPEKSMADI